MQCLNLATKLSKKLPILIISLSWFRGGLCFGIHKKMVQQYLQAFEVRLLNHFNLWCTSQQPLRVTTGRFTHYPVNKTYLQKKNNN